MAYKRRSVTIRRPFKKRRYARRMKRTRYRYTRRPTGYHFRKYMNVIDFAFPVANTWVEAYTTIFNDIRGASDFVNMFDLYRINKIVYKFQLVTDPSAQAAANAVWPTLYWSVDPDSASVPASINELRERGNCRSKVLNCTRPVKIIYRPACQGLIFRGVTSAVAPKYKQWLDMASGDIPHYGLMVGADNVGPVAQQYRMRIERILYFSCKGIL